MRLAPQAWRKEDAAAASSRGVCVWGARSAGCWTDFNLRTENQAITRLKTDPDRCRSAASPTATAPPRRRAVRAQRCRRSAPRASIWPGPEPGVINTAPQSQARECLLVATRQWLQRANSGVACGHPRRVAYARRRGSGRSAAAALGHVQGRKPPGPSRQLHGGEGGGGIHRFVHSCLCRSRCRESELSLGVSRLAALELLLRMGVTPARSFL